MVSVNLDQFRSLYPSIIKDLTADHNEEISGAYQRLEDAIQYNILSRNHYMIFPIYNAYMLLESPSKRTVENIRLANILDWCLELIVSSYLMGDDIIDASETRWQQKCWYMLEEGNIGTYDSKLMEKAGYKLLKQHFSSKPYYTSLLELITTSSYSSFLGQALDAEISNTFKKVKDIRIFTMKKIEICGSYKTYLFQCRLPVHIALLLANLSNSKMKTKVNELILKLSYIQQAQNDMWDCYGVPETYGKQGNDITEGKLTWLIATATQHASNTQLRLLQNNYGQNNSTSNEMVRMVYDELNMMDKYLMFKHKTAEVIHSGIEEIPSKYLRNLLNECVQVSTRLDSKILNNL